MATLSQMGGVFSLEPNPILTPLKKYPSIDGKWTKRELDLLDPIMAGEKPVLKSREEVSEMLTIGLKLLEKLNQQFDEIDRELFKAHIEPDIVGCTDLVSFNSYDADAVAEELETEARGTETIPALRPILIPIIRNVADFNLAEVMMSAPRMQPDHGPYDLKGKPLRMKFYQPPEGEDFILRRV